jgi:glycosyltransferase involved in cell wall biosynthesis
MSNAYKTIIETVEPCSKVAVIPGWVDSDLCTAPLPEKHGVVTAICTNRDYNLKGIPTFKEAARLIPDMKVIKNLPHNELMEVFRKTKVYCQLSYTESFGMSLLESMACGCIPVVSNRDALPEVVADTGFVVPYGDVYKTIKAILVALITDGTPARERAREFTRDKRKEKINELIGEIRS